MSGVTIFVMLANGLFAILCMALGYVDTAQFLILVAIMFIAGDIAKNTEKEGE